MQKPAETLESVQYLTVTADQAGQRIDNFLLGHATGVPRSHIYRIIRTGQVRVNKGRIRPTYKLALDDQVRIPPLALQRRVAVAVPDALVNRLQDAVLLEQDDFLVLNKPAGLAVHAGSGVSFGVIEALRQARQASGSKPELAHRLDRATSGCLLVGKSQRSGRQLQQAFRTRDVRKFYLAFVTGQWPDTPVRVTRSLRRFEESGGQRRVVVDPAGKEAESLFELKAYLPEVDVSLVAVEIFTGRTHQIRVHAASEGHPVVGDSRYGSNSRNRSLKRQGFDRMYLHCARLQLTAGDDLSLDVEAPVDDDWQALLNRYAQ